MAQDTTQQPVTVAPAPSSPDAPKAAEGKRRRIQRMSLEEAKLVGKRFRRQLIPVGVLLLTYVVGWGLYFLGVQHWIVLLAGGAATVTVFALTTWEKWPTKPGLYASAVLAALTFWLSKAAIHGGGAPMPAWLAGVGGLLAMPYWWRYRIRGVRPSVEPVLAAEASDDGPRPIRDWEKKVSCSDGPLPNSRLENVRDLDLPGNWEGEIVLTKGSIRRIYQAMEDIGAALRLRAGSYDILPTPEQDLDRARILVQPNNPLQTVRYWPGPTLDIATGISQIGIYSDGLPVPYRHYRPKSGPIHSLIAGSTDAGKSVLVKELLAEERHSGVIASVLLDPQRGQSYSESGWKKAVPVFAGTIPDVRKKLFDLMHRMYARNDLLSSIKWTNKDGEEIEGVEEFTPCDPRHGLPLISVTIDEAQTVLADDMCRSMVEEMIGMSRKCGIKFRLITQVPLLSSLGNSQPIRDAVASGNVIVFRTGNRLSGQVAFNGVMPVDPVSLPRQWPDGSTTSGLGFVWGPGADRPMTMRTYLIENPRKWATSGQPAEPEPFTGPVYGGDGSSQQNPAGPTAAPTDTDDTKPDSAAEAAILNYLAARPFGAEVARGEIIAFIQSTTTPPPALRTITLAFTSLTSTHDIERVSQGVYRLTEQGRARIVRAA